MLQILIMLNKRLFIAIPISPSDGVLGMLKKALEVDGFGEFKWVPVEFVHITLRFLGDTPVNHIAQICDSISQIASKTVPFRIEIQGYGLFQHFGGKGVLWLSLAPCAALQEVYSLICKKLSTICLPPTTSPFVPHFTIARYKRLTHPDRFTHWIRQHASMPPVRMDVGKIMLMESILQPTGSKYIPLVTWRLGVSNE